jgi:hypothetical protein
VEIGDEPAEVAHHFGRCPARLYQLREPLLLRQPLHDDGDLLDQGRPGEAEAATLVATHGCQVEIDVRCRPAVELDLGDRRGAALLERREVQEPHVHGLLHLVDVVAGEEEVGDVGLAMLDFIYLVLVASGIEKEVDNLLWRTAVAHWTSSSQIWSGVAIWNPIRDQLFLAVFAKNELYCCVSLRLPQCGHFGRAFSCSVM